MPRRNNQLISIRLEDNVMWNEQLDQTNAGNELSNDDWRLIRAQYLAANPSEQVVGELPGRTLLGLRRAEIEVGLPAGTYFNWILQQINPNTPLFVVMSPSPENLPADAPQGLRDIWGDVRQSYLSGSPDITDRTPIPLTPLPAADTHFFDQADVAQQTRLPPALVEELVTLSDAASPYALVQELLQHAHQQDLTIHEIIPQPRLVTENDNAIFSADLFANMGRLQDLLDRSIAPENVKSHKASSDISEDKSEKIKQPDTNMNKGGFFNSFKPKKQTPEQRYEALKPKFRLETVYLFATIKALGDRDLKSASAVDRVIQGYVDAVKDRLALPVKKTKSHDNAFTPEPKDVDELVSICKALEEGNREDNIKRINQLTTTASTRIEAFSADVPGYVRPLIKPLLKVIGRPDYELDYRRLWKTQDEFISADKKFNHFLRKEHPEEFKQVNAREEFEKLKPALQDGFTNFGMYDAHEKEQKEQEFKKALIRYVELFPLEPPPNRHQMTDEVKRALKDWKDAVIALKEQDKFDALIPLAGRKFAKEVTKEIKAESIQVDETAVAVRLTEKYRTKELKLEDSVTQRKMQAKEEYKYRPKDKFEGKSPEKLPEYPLHDKDKNALDVKYPEGYTLKLLFEGIGLKVDGDAFRSTHDKSILIEEKQKLGKSGAVEDKTETTPTIYVLPEKLALRTLSNSVLGNFRNAHTSAEPPIPVGFKLPEQKKNLVQTVTSKITGILKTGGKR